MFAEPHANFATDENNARRFRQNAKQLKQAADACWAAYETLSTASKTTTASSAKANSTTTSLAVRLNQTYAVLIAHAIYVALDDLRPAHTQRTNWRSLGSRNGRERVDTGGLRFTETQWMRFEELGQLLQRCRNNLFAFRPITQEIDHHLAHVLIAGKCYTIEDKQALDQLYDSIEAYSPWLK